MRESWDAVLAKNVVEFLNVISYINDRTDWEKKEREKWRRKH